MKNEKRNGKKHIPPNYVVELLLLIESRPR